MTDHYDGPERRSANPVMNYLGEHWHLDRKVPISIIVTILLQAAAGLWAIADMKKDIEVIKMQVSDQRENDKKQDLRLTETMSQLISRMDHMDAKLDRLVERDRK